MITFPLRKSKSFCRLGAEGNLFESVTVRRRGFARVFDELERGYVDMHDNVFLTRRGPRYLKVVRRNRHVVLYPHLPPTVPETPLMSSQD